MGNQRPGAKAASATSIEISFTYRGKRCRERIKLQPTPANLKKAERHRVAIIEAIAAGTFDYAVTFPNSKNARKFARYRDAGMTIKTYLEHWIDTRESEIHSSTFQGHERTVRNQIIPQFGHLRIGELTRTDVREWCQSMTCSVKRIKNITSILRAALQDAVYDSIIETNPIQGWEFKRREAPVLKNDKINPFSREELAAILAALDGQNRNLVQFWSETGLRPSELIALDWSDVDFIHKRIAIWKALTDAAKAPEPTKTTAGNRIIDLSDAALTALQAQKAHTFLKGKEIFQNPRYSERWTGDRQIREVFWRPTLRKAGVLYRIPYQMRHTYASTRLMAAQSIGDIMHVAATLGHRDWTFTARTYSRFIKEDFMRHKMLSEMLS